MKVKYISNHMANVNYKICKSLYEKTGPSAVYDYCNKIRLQYHKCTGCETDTPTIKSQQMCICAVCGQYKDLPMVFYQQDNIGRAKYTISYHDGIQTHNDGSPFYSIRLFSNKKELAKFRSQLINQGYTEK